MADATEQTAIRPIKRRRTVSLQIGVLLQEQTVVEKGRIIEGCDHLWAVKSKDKEVDELTDLFEKWNNAEYLLAFFTENFEDLKEFFHIERIAEAIEDTFEDADNLESLTLDIPYTNKPDELFKPLDATDTRTAEISRSKARNWGRQQHASWLRIYAIRLETNVYIVTGGSIKLTRTMQEREHTSEELIKLNRCKSYLKDHGVFDQDSFVELTKEY